MPRPKRRKETRKKRNGSVWSGVIDMVTRSWNTASLLLAWVLRGGLVVGFVGNSCCFVKTCQMDSNNTLSAADGSVAVRVCMALVEKVLVVGLYLGQGLLWGGGKEGTGREGNLMGGLGKREGKGGQGEGWSGRVGVRREKEGRGSD